MVRTIYSAHVGRQLNSADNYLNAAHEMYHAVDMLLGSELYTYHSERMVGIMMSDAQEVSEAK
jgi:hypothetical protein